SITPILSEQTILLAVGIIGATVMPHALFVHSWLLKNKIKTKRFKNTDKKTALSYHLTDTVFSLFIAALINAAILIMAAAAFYNSGEKVATIEEAYRTLTPLFGNIASVIFAIALLFAGISSSITGTLAGQSILESLTNFKLSLTIRRIITRVINVIPILIAVLLGIEPLEVLVYSQVILSLLIPIPLLPLIFYSADKNIMGELVNRKITTAVASIFALIIIVFNIYLLYSTLNGWFQIPNSKTFTF
ncbi:MAG: Nramp family divalent metal transporter, partial [Candidatus Anstonellaceae archaeon]